MPDSKNYFLDLAKARKTTYEFSDKNINESNIKKILEDGLRAVPIRSHGISNESRTLKNS